MTLSAPEASDRSCSRGCLPGRSRSLQYTCAELLGPAMCSSPGCASAPTDRSPPRSTGTWSRRWSSRLSRTTVSRPAWPAGPRSRLLCRGASCSAPTGSTFRLTFVPLRRVEDRLLLACGISPIGGDRDAGGVRLDLRLTHEPAPAVTGARRPSVTSGLHRAGGQRTNQAPAPLTLRCCSASRRRSSSKCISAPPSAPPACTPRASGAASTALPPLRSPRPTPRPSPTMSGTQRAATRGSAPGLRRRRAVRSLAHRHLHDLGEVQRAGFEPARSRVDSETVVRISLSSRLRARAGAAAARRP